MKLITLVFYMPEAYAQYNFKILLLAKNYVVKHDVKNKLRQSRNL
jgi:hypothetical protein